MMPIKPGKAIGYTCATKLCNESVRYNVTAVRHGIYFVGFKFMIKARKYFTDNLINGSIFLCGSEHSHLFELAYICALKPATPVTFR